MIDEPGARFRGTDPSHEKGIEVLLKELEKIPPKEPVRAVPPT